MKAVFKHELSSYFSNVTGYVFGAFILLFTGVYMMVYNLQMQYTNFEFVMGGMSFVFLVIVPVLTMRVLAEERRQKTDQLLYSLPLSMTKVVLGKYFALIVMLLIPLGIICLYPLILRCFGNVYLPAAYSAIIGFFFLGASLIAIGTFVSSVTESQPMAAGLCFVVMLLNYFLADLASFVPTTAFASVAALTVVILVLGVIVKLMTRSTFAAVMSAFVLEWAVVLMYILKPAMFEGLFANIVGQLSLFERFYRFTEGVFDLTAIVYFVTVIGVFLFLTVQSMEKRRWSE